MKVAAVLVSVLVFWQASGALSPASAPESLLMMLWGAVLLAFGSLLRSETRAAAPAEVIERTSRTKQAAQAGYAIDAV